MSHETTFDDDPESADAAPIGDGPLGAQRADRLDITPRTGPDRPGAGRPNGSRTRTYVAIGAVAAIVVGLGVVLFNGLQDASTFFYNVDEVVVKQASLQGDRIRVQGNVVDGSVRSTDDGVRFVLRFKGQELPVDHVGDPPELFGPKIPVVLEGTLDGTTFHSDTILIRHDASYDEKNQDRLDDAERDAEQGAPTTTDPATTDPAPTPAASGPGPDSGPALGGAGG